MDYFDAVAKRYSHKERFLPDAVPLSHLEQIARAGLSAPTGMNSQCVNLVLLSNREEIQPLCDIAPTAGLLTAPAAIALLTDSSRQTGQYNFEMEDYAASAAQIMLAATALGYASLWLDSPFFYEARQKAALGVLGAPEDFHLRVVILIGLPDGEGSRRVKHPHEQRMFYGKIG
jgi:nitroreductase